MIDRGDAQPEERRDPVEPQSIATIEPPPPEVTVEPAPIEEPTPPARPPERDEYRVLILGDSMAATDFGAALEAELSAHRRITCARRGKSATGLARPDYFDWMKEAAIQIERHAPDLVVMIIGGNDGQDLVSLDGTRIAWKSEAWSAAYADRVSRIVDLATTGERWLLWLELPVMELPSLEDKLAAIRSVQKRSVEAFPRARWLETRGHFVDASGAILERAAVDGYRRPQALRQTDRIHFTVPGARFFASRVVPAVLELLAL